MNVELKDISDKEFSVDITLKKEDYYEEFKKNLSLYKKNYKRNGFRNNNTPIEVIYREYGLSSLEQVCNKFINEELKKIQEDKKFENKDLLQPIVMESTFPSNKLTIEFNNVEEIKFKYIYAYIDKLNIDDILKKTKDIEVEQLKCTKIDDDILKKIVNDYKFAYFIDEDIQISKENSILFLQDENKQQLALPSKGFKVDGKEVELIGKKTGEIIEINIEDENSIDYNLDILKTVIIYKFKKGINKLQIIGISSFTEKEIKNDLLNDRLLKKGIFDKETDKWLVDCIDLDNITNDNFKDDEIDKNYEKKLEALLFSYSNYFLSKLNRGRIREKILENFKIEIPETYLKEKVKSILNIKEENDFFKQYAEIVLTYNTLNTFFEELIKKFEIKCTDDDIKKYVELKKYIEATEELRIIDNSLSKKVKSGAYDRDNRGVIEINEQMALYKLKDYFKIKEKDITYKEYIDLLK